MISLINKIFGGFQNLLKPIYQKSYILQNIDILIFINIILLIFSSMFAQSDSIACFAVFVILLTVIKFFTKPDTFIKCNFSDKILLVYLILIIISLAGSTLFVLSLKGFLKTLIYIGFYVSLVTFLKDNKNKIKWLFLAFIICSCYEAIIAFMQNYGAVAEISGWQDVSHLNPEEVMTRVYGTLKPYNPNLFGGYMLSIVPLFITLPFIFTDIFVLSNRNKNILVFITCILCLFSSTALILTGCRGAYIGLFFEIIFTLVILYKYIKSELKKLLMYISGLLTLLVSFIVVSISSLRARIFSIFAMRSDSSNSFRFNVYNSCIEMFKDNWLLGIGCGNQNFREIYGLYMKTGFDALSAYNIYLEIAVESGIFALIAFLMFLFNIIKNAITYIFNSKDTNSIYVFAALISIIGMLAHGFVDTVFFRPQIQFTFWIMIAIIRTIVDKE